MFALEYSGHISVSNNGGALRRADFELVVQGSQVGVKIVAYGVERFIPAHHPAVQQFVTSVLMTIADAPYAHEFEFVGLPTNE